MLTKSQNCSWSNRRLHEYRHIFVGKITIFRGKNHHFGWVFCPFLRINVALSWAETSCMSESTCSSFDTEEATDFDCEVGKKCRDDDFLSPYINVYIYIYQCAMVKLLLLDCIHSPREIVISPFSQGYELYIYVYCIYIYTLIMFGFPIWYG
jgi:hypothetical protein